MKAIKVFIYGQRMRDIYPHATKWQVFKYKTVSFLRRVVLCLMVAAFLAGSFYLGGLINPLRLVQATEIAVDPQYPVLDKIAKAESYNSQFCTKEIVAKYGCNKWEVGAVLVRVNTNGTYDIGKYAINSIHLSDAISLGYDVYGESDNFEYAKYLFRTQGSEPWSASKHNWK